MIHSKLNLRNKSRGLRTFSLDLSEVNEQSDDESSNPSFTGQRTKLNDKRASLGTITIDRKLKSIDESAASRKVKFSNFDDSDSNEDREVRENHSNELSTDSQYESQDSNGTPKNTVRHRKISPAYKQNFNRKYSENCVETISQHVSDEMAKTNARKISASACPPSLLNRRDSKLQIFADPESGVGDLYFKNFNVIKIFFNAEKDFHVADFAD